MPRSSVRALPVDVRSLREIQFDGFLRVLPATANGGQDVGAERAIVALRELSTDPGEARFRRRAYAPHVDWGFVARTGDEELLILWDWDVEHEVVRVRHLGPDLLGL